MASIVLCIFNLFAWLWHFAKNHWKVFQNLQIKQTHWISLLFGINKMMLKLLGSSILYRGKDSFIQSIFAILEMMDILGKKIKNPCALGIYNLWGDMGHKQNILTCRLCTEGAFISILVRFLNVGSLMG